MYASPDIRTVRYRVGTANIDVADTRQKKLLREGVAEGELTADMMQNPQAAIDKVVAEMFAKIPGPCRAMKRRIPARRVVHRPGSTGS